MDCSHIQWGCDMNEPFHTMILHGVIILLHSLHRLTAGWARGLWLEVCIQNRNSEQCYLAVYVQNRSSEQFYSAVYFKAVQPLFINCISAVVSERWHGPCPRELFFSRTSPAILMQRDDSGWKFLYSPPFDLCAWNAEVINFSWQNPWAPEDGGMPAGLLGVLDEEQGRWHWCIGAFVPFLSCSLPAFPTTPRRMGMHSVTRCTREGLCWTRGQLWLPLSKLLADM